MSKVWILKTVDHSDWLKPGQAKIIQLIVFYDDLKKYGKTYKEFNLMKGGGSCMSIDSLKSRKSPELIIRELDVRNEIPDIMYMVDIPKNYLRVGVDREQLLTKEIFIPVLDLDELLPLSYTHIKQVGKAEQFRRSYDSYSNYLRYSILYRKANLLKFKFEQGVKVLKETDEQFFSYVPTKEIEYNLIYESSEGRWKQLPSDWAFLEKVREIQKELRSNEVSSLIRDFFKFRREYAGTLHDVNIDFSSALSYANKLISNLGEYYELQNILCEISDRNLELIQEDISKIQKRIETCELIVQDTTLPRHTQFERFISLKSALDSFFKEDGYWVEQDEKGLNIYPNASRLFTTRQKSESSRTPQQKNYLKEFLLFKAQKTSEKCQFINMVDVNFSTEFKAFKKNGI